MKQRTKLLMSLLAVAMLAVGCGEDKEETDNPAGQNLSGKKLVALVGPGNLAINFTWNGDKLSRMSREGLGNYLSFNYNGDKLSSIVEYMSGEVVFRSEYEYQGNQITHVTAEKYRYESEPYTVYDASYTYSNGKITKINAATEYRTYEITMTWNGNNVSEWVKRTDDGDYESIKPSYSQKKCPLILPMGVGLEFDKTELDWSYLIVAGGFCEFSMYSVENIWNSAHYIWHGGDGGEDEDATYNNVEYTYDGDYPTSVSVEGMTFTFQYEE